MDAAQFDGPPTHRPTVTCLCATKGRFSFLAKAVAYYDVQDYEDKELIIFNNHAEPIVLPEELAERKDIKLINAGEFTSIPDVYNSAITFCNSKYTAIWDDDDMYFPWHLSNGIQRLEETGGVAYKPEIQLSWMHNKERVDTVQAISNSCEGSNIILTELLKSSGFGNPDPKGPQHPHPQWQANVKTWIFGNTKEEGFSDPSYVYVWNGSLHLNGHLSQGFEYYALNNTDTGEGNPLPKVDVWEDYTRVFNLLDCKTPEPTSQKFSPSELTALRSKFERYGNLKTDLPDLEKREWRPVSVPVEGESEGEFWKEEPLISDDGGMPIVDAVRLVKECCEKVLPLSGGTVEIGVYRGGHSKVIMEVFAEAGQSNIHIGIDPYGHIPYWDTEDNQVRFNDKASYPAYTNRLGLYMQSKLLEWASDNNQHYLFMKLSDTDFFKIYSQGVPIYDEDRYVLDSYRLVYVDGDHKASAVINAITYFHSRMVDGGIFIFDDVTRYPHQDKVHPVLLSLGYEPLNTLSNDYKLAYQYNKTV